MVAVLVMGDWKCFTIISGARFVTIRLMTSTRESPVTALDLGSLYYAVDLRSCGRFIFHFLVYVGQVGNNITSNHCSRPARKL